jgi:hypothetical protein
MGKSSRPPIVSVETSRPRAGRRFAPTHELEVVPDALEAARQLPGADRGVLVISEMTGPNGIPDLTALVGDPSALHRRLTCDIRPLLNEVDAGIVAVASPRLWRSPSELADALGWHESTVRRRLPALVKAGAVLQRGDRITRLPELQPLGRVYALEAKVRDWRSAMRQARAYSLWADSYVLVLGRSTEAATQLALEQVKADRAGLVVEGRWRRRPIPNKLAPAKRLWAAEHIVAAIRG